MSQESDKVDLEAELKELRAWVRANMRRIEELEATAFQLMDGEEVILIAVQEKRR